MREPSCLPGEVYRVARESSTSTGIVRRRRECSEGSAKCKALCTPMRFDERLPESVLCMGALASRGGDSKVGKEVQNEAGPSRGHAPRKKVWGGRAGGKRKECGISAKHYIEANSFSCYDHLCHSHEGLCLEGYHHRQVLSGMGLMPQLCPIHPGYPSTHF